MLAHAPRGVLGRAAFDRGLPIAEVSAHAAEITRLVTGVRRAAAAFARRMGVCEVAYVRCIPV
jgi:hypothetical protein